MAVKKNDIGAAENEKVAETDISISAAETEKNVEEARTKTQEGGYDPVVKLIYIGPSLPKAALKSNRIFEGTEKEIKKELEKVIEKLPLVEKLLVPVAELAEKKRKAQSAGNILNKYYSDVASASAATEEV